MHLCEFLLCGGHLSLHQYGVVCLSVFALATWSISLPTSNHAIKMEITYQSFIQVRWPQGTLSVLVVFFEFVTWVLSPDLCCFLSYNWLARDIATERMWFCELKIHSNMQWGIHNGSLPWDLIFFWWICCYLGIKLVLQEVDRYISFGPFETGIHTSENLTGHRFERQANSWNRASDGFMPYFS